VLSGIRMTCATPATFLAPASSIDLTLPPNTGQRSIEAYNMPGNTVSVPYIAVPVVMGTPSMRSMGLPM